ncbi:MAG TPA: S8 family serine peptidase [Longimicrobium sp.]|jgi:subtilisin family serine protease|uniref:S8 family peptidase n=1 Tax=Longimicrobium sp. TaxID=2029185 RepID=UPI002EDB2432
MKRIFALLPLLALAACSDPSTVPTAAVPVIPLPSASPSDGYIVVLREGASPASVAAVAGIRPRFVYTAAINGFAAQLNAGQINALRHNPNVARIDVDAPAQLMAYVTQTPATWGIDRINQRDLPLNNTYSYNYSGSGVTAYVLDTGVNSRHVDLYPRASYIDNGARGDFVGDGHGSAADCHGHGTHVAGTIGGTTYGVAKQVRIVAGRVVNCSGNGTASMAIAGMDWITRNGKLPAVVNMSLGYGDVPSVREAATRMVKTGFFVAAAAGNGNYAGVPQNACLQSPAGAPGVVTVGATTSTDQESSFSNYGRCVTLLAPGSSITSAWVGSTTATYVNSGTSMATPHVAGVAAQYLSWVPTATPYDVETTILSLATVGRITLHSASAGGGTPNLLLYTKF